MERPDPDKTTRTQVAGKVARSQSALELARRNETVATERVRSLAKAVDVAQSEFLLARKQRREYHELQAAFEAAEFELAEEQKLLDAARKRREKAAAALQKAESELDEHNRRELTKAPDRFEDSAGKAHTLLTALSGAAIAAGLRAAPPTPPQAAGLIIAIVGAAVGLLSYLPQFIATAVDAMRSHRGTGTSGSLLISWYRAIQIVRLASLLVLIGCVIAAWILLLLAFFATEPATTK